jgi:hypothetical protein
MDLTPHVPRGSVALKSPIAMGISGAPWAQTARRIIILVVRSSDWRAVVRSIGGSRPELRLPQMGRTRWDRTGCLLARDRARHTV